MLIDEQRLKADQNSWSFSSFFYQLRKKDQKNNKVIGSLHAKFWRLWFQNCFFKFFLIYKEIKLFLFVSELFKILMFASIDILLCFCIVSWAWFFFYWAETFRVTHPSDIYISFNFWVTPLITLRKSFQFQPWEATD